MVDKVARLPQELQGGHAGLPCVRWRPLDKSASLPEVGMKVPKEKGFFLPGGNPELRPEYTAYTGSKTMSWEEARARSCKALAQGSVIDKALRLRTRCDDLEPLIEIFMASCSDVRHEPLRAFPWVYNAHRAELFNSVISEDQKRRQIYKALKLHPLTNVYDLARITPGEWSRLSRDLGGIPFGDVWRNLERHVNEDMTPLERAAFWSSVGNRQRVIDHFRQTGFAGDIPHYGVGRYNA